MLWKLAQRYSEEGQDLEGERRLGRRLEEVAVGLLCPYTLMSLSFETAFYIAFAALLALWILIESQAQGSEKMVWNLDMEKRDKLADGESGGSDGEDWRRAYTFLVFLMLGFFGTGNIASINSFDPSFTRCFTTVFDPFLMGGLLLGKVLVPLLLVSVALVAVERVLGLPQHRTLLPLLVCADFMALGFFFLLKDKGSWLEIGTSISHYVIALGTTLAALLLSRLASLMLTARIAIPQNFGLIT